MGDANHNGRLRFVLTTVEGVLPLSLFDAYACWELNRRCFPERETYDLTTFRTLLDSPDSVSYKAVDAQRRLVGFLLGLVDRDASVGAGADNCWVVDTLLPLGLRLKRVAKGMHAAC